MSVIHVGNHLPSLAEKLAHREPLHIARKFGHDVMTSALAAREVSKLEFSGRHALDESQPNGRTVHDLGANALRLPFTKASEHTPHTPDKPGARSVEAIRESVETARLQQNPGLDPNYLYTHPDSLPKRTSQ